MGAGEALGALEALGATRVAAPAGKRTTELLWPSVYAVLVERQSPSIRYFPDWLRL